MKILAVSDKVLDFLYSNNVRQNVPGVDLIIGCGDLPYYYLDFLVSALDVPLLYVHGNHDGNPQYVSGRGQMTSVRGGLDMHATTVNHEGLLIAGLSGSMRYRSGAPYMYTETEMRAQVARLVPRLLWNRQRYGRYLDILIAHSPPYGIHDRSDRAHIGFKVFLNLMRLFKPRYLLHGHIHVYRNDIPKKTRYEQTEVINVYPYRILNIN